MANVYLDRLRDERQSINRRGTGLRVTTEAVGASEYTVHYGVRATLLVAEAITNLADTIQAIHEEDGEGSDQA